MSGILKQVVAATVASRRASAGVILALAAMVYANSLDNSFQYDDLHSIVENQHLRTTANIPAFFSDPTLFSRDPDKAMFRPIVLTSLALNYSWGELDVTSYHLANLLTHVGCALLVWLILTQLGRPACMALLGGLLFAAHPICTEPVNYISSRAELLAALGVLGAFWTYQVAGSRGAVGLQAASLGLFAVGLLSKSIAIGLPALLVVLELYRGGLDRAALRRLAPYLVVTAAYVAVLSGFITKALLDEPVRPLAVQMATQVKALVYYLKLLFVPSGLNVHHAFSEGRPGDVAVVMALLLAISILICASWRAGRRGSDLFLGLGWILVTLTPAAVVPLNVLVNEHRLYLPLAGLVMLFTSLPLERLRGLLWLTLVLLLSLSVMSVHRNGEWQTPYALWQAAAARAPEEVRAYVYMGNYLRDNGDSRGAIEQYERVLQLEPDNDVAANNLGNVYRGLGDWQRAVEIYEQVLARNSQLVDVRYNLARAWQDGGRGDRALPLYLAIARSSFHYDLAMNNAGTLYEQRGRLDSALFRYDRALQVRRDSPQATANWERISSRFEYHGTRLQQLGDFGQLEAAARVILDRESTHRAALFFLAAGLFGQARYSESILQFQRLVTEYPDFGPGYLQLANSLQVSGRLAEAVQAYQALLDSGADRESKTFGRTRLGQLRERSR